MIEITSRGTWRRRDRARRAGEQREGSRRLWSAPIAGMTMTVLLAAVTLASGAGVAAATTRLRAATAASAPPSVTTGAVTAVEPATVTVSGSVNPNGTATTWSFEYGLETNANYPSSTPIKSVGSGKSAVSVSASLSGLAAATSYHYRLVATSAAGKTDGSTGVFNTSAAPVVVTGGASAVGASRATFKATVDPEALATTWYFQYGTTTNYGSKTAAKTLVASPNATTVSVAVTSLLPRTTYHFRIVATSGAGTSYGADLSLTTDLSVSIGSSVSSVVYGRFVRLSGAVSNGKAGARVTVMSERFDASSFSGIASVVTGAGGSWAYSVQPVVRTTYEVFANGGTSSPVLVSVSPAVFLTVNRTGTLTTRVVGAISFAGHVLQLQRLQRGLWVTWKHVLLQAGARATFETSLPKGRTPIRMAIGPFVAGIDQAAPGYLAGYSGSTTYFQR